MLSIDLLAKDAKPEVHFTALRNLRAVQDELRRPISLSPPRADLEISSATESSRSRESRGDFINSAPYNLYRDILVNTSDTLIAFTATLPVASIVLAPRTTLRKSLSEFMIDFMAEELTGRYEDNPAKFLEFIGNYGTHYFRSGLYGGIFNFISTIDARVKEDMTEQQILHNMQLHYGNILARKGVKGLEKHDLQISKDLIATSQAYYGGDAFLLDINSYESWTSTVARNPWLLGGNVAPITELIRNDSIRAQVTKAIDVYTKMAYIQESHRILETHLKRHPTKATKLGPMMGKIHKIRQSFGSNPEEVDNLISELDNVKILVKYFL